MFWVAIRGARQVSPLGQRLEHAHAASSRDAHHQEAQASLLREEEVDAEARRRLAMEVT